MVIIISMTCNCLRCGNEWESKVEDPKYCPNCKSPAWDRPKVKNSEAARAHALVAAAIRSGQLVPELCKICDDEKTVAHHEDYSKPLEVVWLCRKHHRARHKEIGAPLMSSGLLLRGMPNELCRAVKLRAVEQGVTIPEYCRVVLDAVAVRGGVVQIPDVEVSRGFAKEAVAVERRSDAGGDVRGAKVRGGGGTVPLVPAECGEEVELCSYTEYDTDTGATYRCGRTPHSLKVKHTRGEKV